LQPRHLPPEHRWEGRFLDPLGGRSRLGIFVASEDRAIQPELERTMARRMDASVVEISSSHVAMLSHPDATGDLILRAVQAT
jgi:hypothetical protein